MYVGNQGKYYSEWVKFFDNLSRTFQLQILDISRSKGKNIF